MWSFHLYYDKCFAEERDEVLRFIKALMASSRPIRDKNAYKTWLRWRKKKKKAWHRDENQG